MRKLTFVLALVLVMSLLAGCVGTPVVVNCTCPTEGEESPTVPATEPVVVEGAVKTGLAITAKVTGENASADATGKVEYDVTMVAVLVDENGVIVDCVIDSLGTSVVFDAAGAVTTDLTAAIQTKNELGENYGMKAHGGAKFEWNEQAAALASYAKGKTLEELKTGAVNESGYAADVDLAASASIYLGGYVAAIEKAVNNARHLGAQGGDKLVLASTASLGSTTAADAENAGNAQLDCDVTAMTMKGDVISSCVIDSLQAKVAFDATGAITSDLTAPVQTKNELGENYGMKAWGKATYEWNEQAASFAAYVTGKTAAEVAGIAVNEKTAPTDADLAASVTIAIGGFQALIAKGANQ